MPLYGEIENSLELIPKSNTYESIIATLNVLLLAGGGTLRFEAKTYDIGSNYIPVYPYIKYIGEPPNILPPAGLPGDANFDFDGGTVILGDGTNHGFWDGLLDADGFVTGYLDNGSGGAGNIFTLTTDTDPLNLNEDTVSKLLSSSEVTLTSTTGHIITGLLSGTRGVAGSTYSTTGTAQLVGSSGSPVVFGCCWGKSIVSAEGVTIKDVGVKTVLSAIKTGSSNRMGMQFSTIENVFATDCYEDCFSIKNFFHCEFKKMYATFSNGGHLFQQDITAQVIRSGNSTITDMFFDCVPQNGVTADRPLTKGIRIECTDFGQLNEVKAQGLQCNCFGRVQETQAATMTAASADITVTDGTKFVVDLPVFFTSTANGFTSGQIYFVTSVVGNVINVADKQGATETAKASTGTTAINISHWGFPAVSVVGYGTGAVVNGKATDLDTEGAASTPILMQNTEAYELLPIQFPGVATLSAHIALRSSARTRILNLESSLISDFDGNSSNTVIMGFRGTNISGRTGLGMWIDSSYSGGVMQLYYSSTATTEATLRHVSAGGKGFTKPGIGIGNRVTNYSADRTLKAEDCGSVTFDNGANSNATFTLPTLLNAAINSSMVGMTFDICNAGTGTSTLTVNTDGTDLFNKQTGKISYSLAAGQWLSIRAALGKNLSLFWQVIATNGT